MPRDETNNHFRDLGVVELGFGIANKRTIKNLKGCTVGEGARFSNITIGLVRRKFSNVRKMAYWLLGTLILTLKVFKAIVVRLLNEAARLSGYKIL